MTSGATRTHPLVAAAILLALLAPWTSSATVSHSGYKRRPVPRLALNAHAHSSAGLQGLELVRLARTHGKLEAGLDALGLTRLNPPRALRRATVMLSLASHYDHHATFGHLNRFVAAAFPGPHYGHWIAGVARSLRRESRRSLVVQDPHETEMLIRTAQQGRVDLNGIGLLVSDRRPTRRDPAQTVRMLRRHPEVLGCNNHGPEDQTTLTTFHQTIDALLAYRPKGSIFLVHAGERDVGRGGEHSVNRHVEDLRLRSRQDDLRSIHFILAHASRIADIARAKRDLAEIARAGVRVSINPLPPSNIAFGTVDSLTEIDAFRLGWNDLLIGTDNIGSLALNQAVVQAMLRDDLARADALVSPFYQARDGWQRNGKHRLPRADHGNGKRYTPNGTSSSSAPPSL